MSLACQNYATVEKARKSDKFLQTQRKKSYQNERPTVDSE